MQMNRCCVWTEMDMLVDFLVIFSIFLRVYKVCNSVTIFSISCSEFWQFCDSLFTTFFIKLLMCLLFSRVNFFHWCDIFRLPLSHAAVSTTTSFLDCLLRVLVFLNRLVWAVFSAPFLLFEFFIMDDIVNVSVLNHKLDKISHSLHERHNISFNDYCVSIVAHVWLLEVLGSFLILFLLKYITHTLLNSAQSHLQNKSYIFKVYVELWSQKYPAPDRRVDSQ